MNVRRISCGLKGLMPACPARRRHTRKTAWSVMRRIQMAPPLLTGTRRAPSASPRRISHSSNAGRHPGTCGRRAPFAPSLDVFLDRPCRAGSRRLRDRPAQRGAGHSRTPGQVALRPAVHLPSLLERRNRATRAPTILRLGALGVYNTCCWVGSSRLSMHWLYRSLCRHQRSDRNGSGRRARAVGHRATRSSLRSRNT
jgi:hypothetical protein